MSEFNKINNLPPTPRKEIINMQSYSAPLENRRNLLRLDFNENTLGPSQKVYEAIKDIKLNQISIYPEYNLLKNFLSHNYYESRQFDSEEIGLFNGADAVINAIFHSFGDRDEIFLTTNPTFGYYSPCSEIQGMKKITCSYEGEHFLFPIKRFEEKIIKHKPKLIFICNPNNPTGTVLSAQEIIKLANLNKSSLIVVDELYEKFNGDSLLPKIDFQEIKNIVIIQSLSKTAGLAGLRIGFAFGNKSIIQYINKVTGPYDVNSFAVTAALAALNDKSYIDNYVTEVNKARLFIEKKFESLSIRTHFGAGNYFLIWPNQNPEILTRKMRERGILIREMKNKKDIENSVRVSIGTQEQMLRFWSTYKELDLNN
ncbi:Aminotransferases class-I [Prochlorococcus marinus str. MIT 9515]|uniref:Aminotransferase n=1 Tax=Prochlorococcus marinus (strain MIT 9515) TaxID=167542 RepID=A2BUG3_PROM5|nr:histidinol-phosphate transaminase [Prochlorococcus marinus]ABM71424.1 Aminotransferases class-I [Prochlorococcus marinus str. MIT 9515]